MADSPALDTGTRLSSDKWWCRNKTLGLSLPSGWELGAAAGRAKPWCWHTPKRTASSRCQREEPGPKRSTRRGCIDPSNLEFNPIFLLVPQIA